jgi:hypothetical protein
VTEPSPEQFKRVGAVIEGTYVEVACTGCGASHREFVTMEELLERGAHVERMLDEAGLTPESLSKVENAEDLPEGMLNEILASYKRSLD